MLIKQLKLTGPLEARLAACHRDHSFSLSVQQVVETFTEALWDEILPEACAPYHYTIASGRVGPVLCEPGDVLVTRDGEELAPRERALVRTVVLLVQRAEAPAVTTLGDALRKQET